MIDLQHGRRAMGARVRAALAAGGILLSPTLPARAQTPRSPAASAVVQAVRPAVPIELRAKYAEVPASHLSAIERAIISRTGAHFDALRRHTLEEIHTKPRLFALDSEDRRWLPDFDLRYDVHCILYFAAAARHIPGAERLAREITDFVVRSTIRHGGVFPAFDVGCVGPKVMEVLALSGSPETKELIRNSYEQMMGLRTNDGGWTNLDYTRGRPPLGMPDIRALNHLTSIAVTGLLASGYSLEDPRVRGGMEANDRSILQSEYKGHATTDYILGDALTLQLWKLAGVSNFEAFEKVQAELTEFLMSDPKEGHLYLVAEALLGLQGFLPEWAPAYRRGWQLMQSRYDPPSGTFIIKRSAAFGKTFHLTACFLLEPYFVLKRSGYDPGFLVESEVPRPKCDEPALRMKDLSAGRRHIRVEGKGRYGLQIARSSFESIRTWWPSSAEELPPTLQPDEVVRLVVPCGRIFRIGPWMK